jgi:sodium transport system permease protein
MKNSLKWYRVRTIWFKELMDSLRDRKALRQAILMPLIVGLLYAVLNPLMESLMTNRIEAQQSNIVTVTTLGSRNVDAGLENVLQQFEILLQEYDGTLAALEAEIMAGDQKVALVIPDGFGEAVAAERSAELRLLVNQGGDMFEMDMRGNRLMGAIQAYSQMLVVARLAERGIEPALLTPIQVQQVNLTTPAQQAGTMAGFMLPILVAVVVVSGGMLIAIDVTAGEKERGTLESLLLTPASDLEIFLGKLLAVFTMTTVPLIITFAGYGVASNLLPRFMDTTIPGVPFAVIAGVTLVSLPLALAVNVVLMVIAVRTKTFKDAQSAMTPLSLGVMFPMMGAAFLPPKSLLLYLIPAYGTGAVASRLALEGTIFWPAFWVSVIGCLLLLAAGSWFAMRLFNRERLLYSQ